MNPNGIMYISPQNGTYQQANSPITLSVSPDACRHQMTFDPGTATSGTCAMTFKPIGVPGTETLKDIYGAAVVFNAASGQQTVVIPDLRASEVIATFAAMNGTVNLAISGLR